MDLGVKRVRERERELRDLKVEDVLTDLMFLLVFLVLRSAWSIAARRPTERRRSNRTKESSPALWALGQRMSQGLAAHPLHPPSS
jgi:hypothetical protein